MSDNTFRLRVATPVDIKLDEPVEMVIMRCTTGEMGILAGHSNYSAVLDYGVLRVHSNGQERHLAVYGGLAVMRDGELSIFTNDAEWPDDIDISRSSYHEQGRDKISDIDLLNDQVKLRRALVQIEVGSSTISNQD